MHVANPMNKPSNIFMYTLRPTRLTMLTEGATDAERMLAGQHWAYSQELLAKGIIVFGGRTTDTTADAFAFCVIRAESEEAAKAVMDGDPAVAGGVFRAQLFPFQPMLMGEWPAGL